MGGDLYVTFFYPFTNNLMVFDQFTPINYIVHVSSEGYNGQKPLN